MSESVRYAVEVNAGLVPGQPMPEFTKQWFVTSNEWAAAGEGSHNPDIEGSPLQEAIAYAKTLYDPGMLNWVRLDWVWF